MAYSNLYRDSGPNKMAPLASLLWEQEQYFAQYNCQIQTDLELQNII